MSNTLNKSDAITKITLTTFRLNGILTEWGNQFTLSSGLTTPRWQILGAIALAKEPLTMPQIATMMGITRQGVLKQINNLVQDDLIVAKPNPLHKRSALYELTEKGYTVFNKINSEWEKYVLNLVDLFDESTLETTIKVLDQLSVAFK